MFNVNHDVSLLLDVDDSYTHRSAPFRSPGPAKDANIPMSLLPTYSDLMCSADAIMQWFWFLKGSAPETPRRRFGGEPSQMLQGKYHFLINRLT